MDSTKAWVFLGGTCNNSQWREELMPKLTCNYFNPVVPDWNEAAQKKELYIRENADFVLYVITPMMTGGYSIAEVVDDSNKRPEKTILCVLEKDGDAEFTFSQMKSMKEVCKMVVRNGGRTFKTLDEIADFLNAQKK